MKVYKIGNEIINLAMVKNIHLFSSEIGFYFSDPTDWIRVEIKDKKEGEKILQECYEIMKKED